MQTSPPASRSLGWIIAVLALLALLAVGWYALRAGERVRAARAESAQIRMESRARVDSILVQRGELKPRLDSLIGRGDSLLGEIDGLRLHARVRTDSLTALSAGLRRSLDSLRAAAEGLRTDTIAVAGPDTCCPKVDVLLAGFLASQREIRRLRAEHDIRVLFVLDAFATIRFCAADTGAPCSDLRRRIIAEFDSAAVRAGWETQYCKLDREIFAVDAVDACLSVKQIQEKWGLAIESAYMLGLTVASDPCALTREEMQLLVKDCVGRLRGDMLTCSDDVRGFAGPYLSPAFTKELRQRIGR